MRGQAFNSVQLSEWAAFEMIVGKPKEGAVLHPLRHWRTPARLVRTNPRSAQSSARLLLGGGGRDPRDRWAGGQQASNKDQLRVPWHHSYRDVGLGPDQGLCR